MPSVTSYQVLFDVINDSNEYATVQLLRDYRSPSAPVVLLPPRDSISLVLDAGAVYQYAVKMHSKVANIRFVPPLYSSCWIKSYLRWILIMLPTSLLCFLRSPHHTPFSVITAYDYGVITSVRLSPCSQVHHRAGLGHRQHHRTES
jgi:hypothetical protein